MPTNQNKNEPSKRGQTKCVMLIDDNLELLNAMSTFLRNVLGYSDVQTFENVDKAVAFLDDGGHTDVVLIDQKMGGDEGAGIEAIPKFSGREPPIRGSFGIRVKSHHIFSS